MNYRIKSDFLKVMMERGFLSDCTNYENLDTTLTKKIVPGYIGFDATAASLHVGSLMQIMMLRWLQRTGHQPIVLMGGGTTKVGDPSFRADERPLLTPQKINMNISSIKNVFKNYVNFNDSSNTAIMVDNAEWLDDLNYLSFLRDVGKHFSVNRMLSFESVKSRLDREQSLSFLEFNYMILQAYDFMELNKRYGCLLQMGGSDQWGNIVNGIDLTRRSINIELFGLTSPLLETSEGKKMGKSQDGAIWLDKKLVSSYQFWQYWRNTSDADVGKFLKLYTEIPLDECIRLGKLKGAELNEAKIILANHVTALLHGDTASKAAEQTASDVFIKGTFGDELPTLEISSDELVDGISIIHLFVKTGLVNSGKEAKRLISEHGARLNGSLLTDHKILIKKKDLQNDIKLSAGKKRHALVKIKPITQI